MTEFYPPEIYDCQGNSDVVERELYYRAARDAYQGAGEIVIAGAVDAVVATCVAAGLRNNPKVAAKADRIHVFSPSEMRWDGRPVEVLFVYGGISADFYDTVIQILYGSLIAGVSLVIDKDFISPAAWWLPCKNEVLANELVPQEVVASTVVARAIKAIPPQPEADRLAALSRARRDSLLDAQAGLYRHFFVGELIQVQKAYGALAEGDVFAGISLLTGLLATSGYEIVRHHAEAALRTFGINERIVGKLLRAVKAEDDVGRANFALYAETCCNAVAKSPDTAAQFAKVWGQAAPHIVRAAQPFRQPIPRAATPKLRIGFFLASTAQLAHTVNLLTFLSGLRKIESPMEPFIYVMHRENEDFSRAFPDARYCISKSQFDGWRTVRARAMEDQISAMVFVSNPLGMTFASTMCVAPRHIWWSHKWHGMRLPHLDGYIDATGGAVESPWVKAYTALPELFQESLTEHAKVLRAGMQARVVFGTLCREEKITARYVQCVHRILDRVAEAIFVYTGREPVPDLHRAHGERVRFIGWVNTALWSQVIDVFLDTFPFANGHTAWEAVAARKPIVLMEPDPTEEQSYVAANMKLANWPYHAAADDADYVNVAVDFAGGAVEPWVESNHRFYRTHMRDEARMATEVSQAIVDIVDRT